MRISDFCGAKIQWSSWACMKVLFLFLMIGRNFCLTPASLLGQSAPRQPVNSWFICIFCIVYLDVILMLLICIVSWFYLIVYNFGIGYVTFPFVSIKLVICAYLVWFCVFWVGEQSFMSIGLSWVVLRSINFVSTVLWFMHCIPTFVSNQMSLGLW